MFCIKFFISYEWSNIKIIGEKTIKKIRITWNSIKKKVSLVKSGNSSLSRFSRNRLSEEYLKSPKKNPMADWIEKNDHLEKLVDVLKTNKSLMKSSIANYLNKISNLEMMLEEKSVYIKLLKKENQRLKYKLKG